MSTMVSFINRPPAIPADVVIPDDMSASFGAAQSFANQRARELVEQGRAAWTEVRGEGGVPIYQAWRVSPVSWAWRTSAMDVPAFERIDDDRCPDCGHRHLTDCVACAEAADYGQYSPCAVLGAEA